MPSDVIGEVGSVEIGDVVAAAIVELSSIELLTLLAEFNPPNNVECDEKLPNELKLFVFVSK